MKWCYLYLFKHSPMKRTATILASFIFGFFLSMQLSAQCEPDTAKCEDIGDPGQICPLKLPKAGLDVLYDEVVTIIPPGTYKIGETVISISYIVIDSVKNLPPGIDYFPNADILFADTAYCAQITGTPNQIGNFALHIYITPYIEISGDFYPGPQVVDDTSIVITVVDVLGIEAKQMTEFQLFQNVPNPFSDITRLAYYAPVNDRIELCVYNILGVQVHQESNYVLPGEHYFEFNGSELQCGTYLYRVKTRDGYYTGKLVKSN